MTSELSGSMGQICFAAACNIQRYAAKAIFVELPWSAMQFSCDVFVNEVVNRQLGNCDPKISTVLSMNSMLVQWAEAVDSRLFDLEFLKGAVSCPVPVIQTVTWLSAAGFRRLQSSIRVCNCLRWSPDSFFWPMMSGGKRMLPPTLTTRQPWNRSLGAKHWLVSFNGLIGKRSNTVITASLRLFVQSASMSYGNCRGSLPNQRGCCDCFNLD